MCVQHAGGWRLKAPNRGENETSPDALSIRARSHLCDRFEAVAVPIDHGSVREPDFPERPAFIAGKRVDFDKCAFGTAEVQISARGDMRDSNARSGADDRGGFAVEHG